MLQAETPVINGIFILFMTLKFQYFQNKSFQSVNISIQTELSVIQLKYKVGKMHSSCSPAGMATPW